MLLFNRHTKPMNRMERVLITTMLVIALLLAHTILSIQIGHAASATGTATAEVVQPITLSVQNQLDFGSFTASATTGSVTVSSGGTTTGGGTTKVENGSRGSFTVAGDRNRTYNITLDSSVTLNGSGSAAGNSMNASILATNNSGSTITAATLNGSGNGSFFVDGTLTVGANQIAGTYTGSYTVSVDY